VGHDKPEPIWLNGQYAAFDITIPPGDRRREQFRRVLHSIGHRPGVADVGYNETAGITTWIVTLEGATLVSQTPREARKFIDGLLNVIPGPHSYRLGMREVSLKVWRRIVTGHRLA